MRNALFMLTLIVSMAPAHAADRLRIVASIKPLQLLVLAVGGDDVDVTALLHPSASPHDYQLRPSDRLALENADAVVWVGPALEHFMRPALKVLPRTVVVIGLQDREADPHVWMDPVATRAAAQRVAAVLKRLAPASAPRFEANLARLDRELALEEAQVRQRLNGSARRGYIVEHDAYARFEKRFGLRHRAALTDAAELPPSMAVLKRVRDLVEGGAVACVLTEPAPSAHIRALSGEMPSGASVKIVRLDPMAAAVPVTPNALPLFYRRLGEDFAKCLS